MRDLNSTVEEMRRSGAIFTSLLDLAELYARPFFWRMKTVRAIPVKTFGTSGRPPKPLAAHCLAPTLRIHFAAKDPSVPAHSATQCRDAPFIVLGNNPN